MDITNFVPGRRARSSSMKRSATKISPTLTAWIQTQPPSPRRARTSGSYEPNRSLKCRAYPPRRRIRMRKRGIISVKPMAKRTL